MTLTQVIYGMFFQPVSTLQFLSKEKPIFRGLVVFFLVLLFNMLINRGIGISQLNQTHFPLNADLIWIWDLLGSVFSIFALFLMAGLFSLLSEIIYGHGNGGGLLVCLSFACVPGVLGPPLRYAAVLLGVSGLGVVFSLIAFIWVIILQVISLREALSLETGQAVLIFLLPVLTMIMLGVSVFFLVVTTFPISY